MEAVKNVEFLVSEFKDHRQEAPRRNPKGIKIFQFAFGIFGRLFPKSAGKIAYRLFTTPQKRARHQVSDPILEKARLFEVLFEKHLLKCYAWGKGESTILLVHGWESRGTSMKSFVQPLVEKGFRVVTFDGPAHGNSGGTRTNIPHFAGAVNAVIHHLDEVHAIIAHSFGGPASIFGMRHLDPSISLEKLIFIGVPASSQNVFNQAVKMMNLPKKAAKQFYEILNTKLKGIPFEEADVYTAHGEIKVKETLIVHDKKDKIVPFSAARRIYDNWNNANLLISDGYGHYRLMKNPDLVKRVVDFIM